MGRNVSLDSAIELKGFSPSAAPRYALIGAAGYVAPRHMRAIAETGGQLRAAFDPADSVGIIDSYFPDSAYFSEFERFDRHVDKLRRRGDPIEFVSICSPNYLHDAHIRFALRSGAHAICEKPLVLNPWNLDALEEIESGGERAIFTILQLRLHPAIAALKRRIDAEPDRTWDVDLGYIAARGRWYHSSWKGEEKKSGGIATNIGIHFFDMLVFVFGRVLKSVVHLRDDSHAAGWLELERARVRWYLSIDRADLPGGLGPEKTTYRSLSVDGDEIEFSEGFTDLHTASYRAILDGRGYRVADVRPSIETVAAIRNAPLEPGGDDRHPWALKRL